MSIDDMFEMILDDPYIWGKTGMSEDRRHYFRYWHRKRKNVSVGRKMDIIRAAGYQMRSAFFDGDGVIVKKVI